MTYYISIRLVDSKLRKVIVDETCKIVENDNFLLGLNSNYKFNEVRSQPHAIAQTVTAYQRGNCTTQRESLLRLVADFRGEVYPKNRLKKNYIIIY
jgi:hypothetical protein